MDYVEKFQDEKAKRLNFSFIFFYDELGSIEGAVTCWMETGHILDESYDHFYVTRLDMTLLSIDRYQLIEMMQ